MPKQNLAIALCRVSSLEQLKNNSLATQKGNVLRTAEELKVLIPTDGIWEGQVSSKKGVNYNRKDLLQMYDYCKRNTAVKYLLVQEVDRFMRSPDEQTYWYVRFWYELNVKIWFADKPELNEDTHVASLLRYMEGWRAGGSNEERINKSINGQTAALKEGRWPFIPKPGYMKGRIKSIPNIHPTRGPALQKTLLDIYYKRVTPTQALIEFNKSDFMVDGHSRYKMDKFRKIATDPFYAGIVEIDRQVQARKEHALHDPLITIEQHKEIVRIFDNKKKSQSGPRINGNPDFPLSNLVTCELCIGISTIPRYAGYNHGNGKNPNLIYHKYRCRSCNRYLTREELHPKVIDMFEAHPITSEGVDDLLKALDIVWKRREVEAEKNISRIMAKIKVLKETISNQAIAAVDPSNIQVKQELIDSVVKNKKEVSGLEDELNMLTEKSDFDKERFLRFAFSFIENMGNKFLEIPVEDRLRCKQAIFPAGFYLDADNNVYTPKISPLITLQVKKKDAEASMNSHLVRVKGL